MKPNDFTSERKAKRTSAIQSVAKISSNGAMVEGHEGTLISRFLNDATAVRRYPDLRPEHFASPIHREIFDAIQRLHDDGHETNFLAVKDYFARCGRLEQIGEHTLLMLATDSITALDDGCFDYAKESMLDAYREREAMRIFKDGAAGHITADDARERLNTILAQPEADNLPKPRSLMALSETDPAIFEADNLLGNRFLCAEGAMLFVAPSGIGKSSAGVQQDILWSLGRPAFGIRPARPLRILCVQAENDDGDLAEMTRGICDHLQLSDEERRLVGERVIYITEKSFTGEAFLGRLRRLVEKYEPDIVRIDPMHAYAGGDVRDPAITTPFLRNGLNPILQEFQCAAIVVHHTPKTTYRNTSEWTATDWMYAGAGNADVTNWARAILVIDATSVHGAFVFRAAKRGSRIGWADDDGHRIYDRLFCHHAGDAIFWRDATNEDIERVAVTKSKKGEPLKTAEDFKALVPLDEEIPKLALIERANLNGFGLNRAKRLLAGLVAEGELFEWRVSRKGTCPEVRIARREQVLI